MDDADFSRYPFVKGRLVEFVQCESRYAPLAWSLLGRTLVVDSLEAAMELPARLRAGYSFVTLSGECLSADGLLRLGPLGKATGLISRRSRINQLEGTIATLNAEIAQLESRIQQNSQSKAHLEKLCKELRTAIYEANTEKMQVNSKLGVYERDIKRLKDEEPLIAGEIGSLETQIAQSVQREYDSKQRLSELEVVNNERKARIADLEGRYGELRDQQQDRMQDLTDLKVQLGQVLEQQKGLRQIIDRLEGQMQASLRTLAGGRGGDSGRRQSVSSRPRGTSSTARPPSPICTSRRRAPSRTTGSCRSSCETLVGRAEAEGGDGSRPRGPSKTEVEHKINELRIELGQVQVRQQGLIDRVKEELQIDLAQTYETRTTGSDVDWEQVKNEITELRGKIERLGNVNLDAIAEQDTLEERHNFLANQVQDLTESKNQLEAADRQAQQAEPREVRRDLRADPRELPGDLPQALRRRQGRHRPGGVRRRARSGHRGDRQAPGQGDAKHLAAQRRREVDDRDGAAVLGLPDASPRRSASSTRWTRRWTRPTTSGSTCSCGISASTASSSSSRTPSGR